MLRAAVSIASIKSAPSAMLAGTTLRLSFPKIIRAACGMSSPTQPMRPHIETTEAVIIAAPVITSSLTRFTFIPSDVASSSLSVIALSFQRKSQISAIPAAISGAPIARLARVVPDRLPISQNVIDGSTSCGSAAYFTSDTSAEKSALTTMPASIIMITEEEPRTRLTKTTSATAAIPAASAKSCTRNEGSPINMPKTAPKEAPVATPSVSGVASGLEKSA